MPLDPLGNAVEQIYDSVDALSLKYARASIAGQNSAALTVPKGETWSIQYVDAVVAANTSAGDRNYYLKTSGSLFQFDTQVSVTLGQIVLLRFSPTLESSSSLQSTVDKVGDTKNFLVVRTDFLSLYEDDVIEVADSGIVKDSADSINMTVHYYRSLA